MNHANPTDTNNEELRAALLPGLFGLTDGNSEELYVDTKAKFLLDDLVPIVQGFIQSHQQLEANKIPVYMDADTRKELELFIKEQVEAKVAEARTGYVPEDQMRDVLLDMKRYYKSELAQARVDELRGLPQSGFINADGVRCNVVSLDAVNARIVDLTSTEKEDHE
jgi:hypothetical protein